MMEMQKPQEAHRKLQALVGTWVGEEKLFPSPWDPKGGSALGRFQARVDLDGFFVICDYTEERGGQVTYRGHGVFGYDPQQKTYTMNWFDSIGPGSPAPARGKWEGNQLLFENSHPRGHSRYIYTFEGNDRYTFRLENSTDGKSWAPMMEGKYKRP